MENALNRSIAQKGQTIKDKSYKGIYALCDIATLDKKNKTISEFLNICHSLDVKLIQYRDKTNSIQIQKENLIFLKQNTNIKIIINDKIELIDYADGLHLGQEDLLRFDDDFDMAIKIVRKKLGKKIFGISTHNINEVLQANNADIDYIGLGAYRLTNTKDVSNLLIEEDIAQIACQSKHDVCLIGGVKKSDKVENISYNVIGSDLYEY